MLRSVPLRACSLHQCTSTCELFTLGFREVHVEALAGDVMAGAGGVAGPAPDVRHQPPGDTHTLTSFMIMIIIKAG